MLTTQSLPTSSSAADAPMAASAPTGCTWTTSLVAAPSGVIPRLG